MTIIKNGTIHDAIQQETFIADIFIENGKIKEIGTGLLVGNDVQVIDATGKHIYPGFVEAHGHIGLDGYGIG